MKHAAFFSALAPALLLPACEKPAAVAPVMVAPLSIPAAGTGVTGSIDLPGNASRGLALDRGVAAANPAAPTDPSAGAQGAMSGPGEPMAAPKAGPATDDSSPGLRPAR